MTDTPPHWNAWIVRGSLRISGDATRYPNDYCTASLIREPDDPSAPDVLIYRVVFHRDKEPFCGPDLYGPVSYVEHTVPIHKSRVRIIAAEGTFDVPLTGK